MDAEHGEGKGGMEVQSGGAAGPEKAISLTRLIFSCMVAGGVQYGWALQLSLLTPFVQTLGLSHEMSSLMWLCGPIAGFVVQPVIGLWSDRSRSRFGRRRPFICVGCILICLSVLAIAFSSDIGFALGDTKEDCKVYHGPRWIAAIVYVVGFWFLDLSNNACQGPARALMADLSGPHGCSAANAIFCSWMAFGSIVGYAAGSTAGWHTWFPFLNTRACCDACANLKGAFLVAVVAILICLTVTLIVAQETPLPARKSGKGFEDMEVEQGVGLLEIFRSIKNLPAGMPAVLFLTSLTWLAWNPFSTYDTDWMGREVYHGDPKGTVAEINAYNAGVRKGAFGLLLNAIVLGVSSFLLEPMCRKVTARLVWVGSNFILGLALAATALISMWSLKTYNGLLSHVIVGPDGRVKAAALALFAFLGVPLSVIYSIPFAYVAQLAQNGGGGQGLCTGVLNISIVIPQVIVSLGAGPWDAIFGQGNIPAFALASAVAFVSSVVGFFVLPRISRSQFRASSMGGH